MMISTFGRAAAEAERKENTPRPSCLRKSARVRFTMIGPASATTGAMRMSEARPGETRGASSPKASTAMHDDTALSTPGADSAVHRRAEADPYLMPSSPGDPERSARRGGPIPHRQVFPDPSRSFQVVIGKGDRHVPDYRRGFRNPRAAVIHPPRHGILLVSARDHQNVGIRAFQLFPDAFLVWIAGTERVWQRLAMYPILCGNARC